MTRGLLGGRRGTSVIVIGVEKGCSCDLMVQDVEFAEGLILKLTSVSVPPAEPKVSHGCVRAKHYFLVRGYITFVRSEENTRHVWDNVNQSGTIVEEVKFFCLHLGRCHSRPIVRHTPVKHPRRELHIRPAKKRVSKLNRRPYKNIAMTPVTSTQTAIATRTQSPGRPACPCPSCPN